MQPTKNQLLKVSEAAKLMNVAPETIYKQIREHNLAHFRVGSDIRLDAGELLEHFKRAACDGQ